MDENDDQNKSTPDNNQGDINSNGAENIESVSVVEASKPKNHVKRGRRRAILSIILLILLVGGVSAYFYSRPDSYDDQSVNIIENADNVKADTKLFTQLNQKITSYDVTNKTSTVVTNEVPKNATVLDFYYDNRDGSWRYYAEQNSANNAKSQIYYADNISEPKLVTEQTSLSDVEANAEQRVMFYQTLPDQNKSTTMKTYQVNYNADPKLIYESSKYGEKDNDNSLKAPTYFLADISPNAAKILFQKASCLFCDGGPTNELFELDLKSMKTAVINDSNHPAEKAFYTTDGAVIAAETNLGGLGQPPAKAEININKIVRDTKTELLKFSEKNVVNFDISKDAKYVTISLAAATYNQDSSVTFGGLFELKNNKLDDLKVDLKSVNGLALSLGKDIGDCISASSRKYIQNGQNEVDSVGVFCKNFDGTYEFKVLDTATTDAQNSDFVEYKLL